MSDPTTLATLTANYRAAGAVLRWINVSHPGLHCPTIQTRRSNELFAAAIALADMGHRHLLAALHREADLLDEYARLHRHDNDDHAAARMWRTAHSLRALINAAVHTVRAA